MAMFMDVHDLGQVSLGDVEKAHAADLEKQDEHGVEQLKLAIQVVRAFVLAEASSDRTGVNRSVILKHLNRIERMMLSDAGRKIAKRFGVHVADAME